MQEEVFPGVPDRRSELRVGLTVITLMEGDISEADVDAIVHVPGRLTGPSGRSLREKSGPDMYREWAKAERLPVGEAIMTAAGGLRARRIIHVTMPQGELYGKEEGYHEAIHNALSLAGENHLTSLALPGTAGTGSGAVVFARLILEALVDFLEMEKTPLRRIEVCMYGLDEVTAYTQELEKIRTRRETANRV